jgi:hypothetical protein
MGMGTFLKASAKVWFFAWDIPAAIALFDGYFHVFFLILVASGVTAAMLWICGDHLETKSAPAKSTAWRKTNGLDR